MLAAHTWVRSHVVTHTWSDVHTHTHTRRQGPGHANTPPGSESGSWRHLLVTIGTLVGRPPSRTFQNLPEPALLRPGRGAGCSLPQDAAPGGGVPARQAVGAPRHLEQGPGGQTARGTVQAGHGLPGDLSRGRRPLAAWDPRDSAAPTFSMAMLSPSSCERSRPQTPETRSPPAAHKDPRGLHGALLGSRGRHRCPKVQEKVTLAPPLGDPAHRGLTGGVFPRIFL